MAFNELDAVNRILTLTGEAPVTSLGTPRSATVAAARGALEYARKALTGDAHFWNTERRSFTPSADDDYEIRFGPEVVDVRPLQAEYADHRARFVLRGDQLWDQQENTGRLEGYGTFYLMVVRDLPFDDLPQPVQQMVIADALRAVASQQADPAMMQVADREYMAAQISYRRFITAPGRVQFLRPHTAYDFRRALQ